MAAAPPADGTANLSARFFGLALHHALEVMGRFDAPSAELAYHSALNHYGRVVQTAPIQARLEALLRSAEFVSLIEGRRTYQEVPLIDGQERMRLDLLIRTETGWIVADYKSGQSDESHHAQVRRYLSALRKHGITPAEGVIIYLGDPVRVVPVSDV